MKSLKSLKSAFLYCRVTQKWLEALLRIAKVGWCAGRDLPLQKWRKRNRIARKREQAPGVGRRSSNARYKVVRRAACGEWLVCTSCSCCTRKGSGKRVSSE